MSKGLILGKTDSKIFEIPLECVTKAFAILGIRDSGKSCGGTVMAEELCKQRQPWIAFDPVSNWWGLRSKPDGSPGGFPVVVFGGDRGDLPLDKGMGPKIAEAILTENVFAVIDLKMTSKTMWRTVVRDIVSELFKIQADIPRMVFFEESQEFIPQRPSHQLGAECKEIVERLVTLGGNWGYGATLLGQRPASIEKSALSQCETIFAFRTQGSHDRKAIQDWFKQKQVQDDMSAALDELPDLETGTAWCWSPNFLKTFAKVRFRVRETLHPRDARKRGMVARDIELAPVNEFVVRVRRQLTKVQAVVDVELDQKKQGRSKVVHAEVSAPQAPQPKVDQIDVHAQELVQLKEKASRLQGELETERGRRRDAERRIDALRAHLKPQYEALQRLFSDMGSGVDPAAGSGVDPAVWEPWLVKAGSRGCKRMLEILIERGNVTRTQLGTLAGVSSIKSTFRTYLGWLKNNNLVEVDGDTVRLKAV